MSEKRTLVSVLRRSQNYSVDPEPMTGRAQHDLPRIIFAATYSVAQETAVRFRESAVAFGPPRLFYARSGVHRSTERVRKWVAQLMQGS